MFKAKFKSLYCVLVFWLGITPAQANTYKDFQTWWTLLTLGNFKTQDGQDTAWKYWLEVQERLGDQSRRGTQVLVRAAVGLALNKEASLWQGYAWSTISGPLTRIPYAESLAWQQLLWIKSYPTILLTSRTRIEERYIERSVNYSYRLRQLGKINIPFHHYENLFFVTSDEVFVHLNSFAGLNNQGFSQNRFFMGAGYKFSSTLNAEMGFLKQSIRRVGRPDFVANSFALFLFFYP